MKVLIVVTHLLGTGHLARALTLGRAFVASGHQVCVASGGFPAPHLEDSAVPQLQLPPLRSDGVDFTRLMGTDGIPAKEETFAQRQAMLLAQLTAQPWDAVITELFPFGRRILRAEFLALLGAARALPKPPLICASVRDILAPPSTPQKAARTETILRQFYDAVLVHSDPAITPLETSWPVSDMLAARLRYTGFVAPPAAPPHPDQLGQGEIIVSAGGGDVGTRLFEAACAAAKGAPQRWRVLVGGKNAAPEIDRLRAGAPANLTVEPARKDFRQVLHHAAASVSMCGYNTALDLLQSGCPAALVPFDAGNEVEQTLRAKALAAQPGIQVLPDAALTPAALAAAVQDVLAAPRRAPMVHGLDGADRSVQIISDLVKARA